MWPHCHSNACLKTHLPLPGHTSAELALVNGTCQWFSSGCGARGHHPRRSGPTARCGNTPLRLSSWISAHLACCLGRLCMPSESQEPCCWDGGVVGGAQGIRHPHPHLRWMLPQGEPHSPVLPSPPQGGGSGTSHPPWPPRLLRATVVGAPGGGTGLGLVVLICIALVLWHVWHVSHPPNRAHPVCQPGPWTSWVGKSTPGPGLQFNASDTQSETIRSPVF